MTTTITYLNHSSVLIEKDEFFIWTDPLYDTPAFGSWLSAPPMYLNPTYLLAVAYANPEKFLVLISHGHDDHLDENILSLFTFVSVATTDFSSSGVTKRLSRIGFKNVTHLTDKPFKWGPFELYGYINETYSRDDSVQTIISEDLTFVHANDCWFDWGTPIRHKIKSTKRGALIHASQVQNATGSFPFAYENLANELKEKEAEDLILRHLISTIENFNAVEGDLFFCYAGHVKIFSFNEVVNHRSGFIDFHRLLDLSRVVDRNFSDKLVDFRPGDLLKNRLVYPAILRGRYTEDHVKNASVEYWNKYGTGLARHFRTDSNSAELTAMLGEFKRSFEEYVLRRTREFLDSGITYFFDILKFRIEIVLSDVSTAAIEFPQFDCSNPRVFKTTWTKDLGAGVLTGHLNWEVTYVGALGRHERYPPEESDLPAVRWLAMFGYIWQRSASAKHEGPKL